MLTYYQILKVSPTATAAEIETALDTQYHQWRRLVTHHDSNIADEATRALHTLEQIRATLLTTTERAKYDAILNVGGLADPDALLRSASPPPPLPPAETSPTKPASVSALDVWICPQCQTPNTKGTKHCHNCGKQLAITCPKCGQLTQFNARHCSECGVNLQQSIEEMRAQELARLQERLEYINTQLVNEKLTIQGLETTRNSKTSERLLGSQKQLVQHSLSQEKTGCGMTFLQIFMMVFGHTIAPLLIVVISETRSGSATAFARILAIVVWGVSVFVVIKILNWLNYKIRRAKIEKRIPVHRNNIVRLEQEFDQLQQQLQQME